MKGNKALEMKPLEASLSEQANYDFAETLPVKEEVIASSKRTLLRVASSRNLSLSSPAHAQAVVKLHTLS